MASELLRTLRSRTNDHLVCVKVGRVECCASFYAALAVWPFMPLPLAMGYRFGQTAFDHPAASIAAPTSTPAASTSATARR